MLFFYDPSVIYVLGNVYSLHLIIISMGSNVPFHFYELVVIDNPVSYLPNFIVMICEGASSFVIKVPLDLLLFHCL